MKHRLLYYLITPLIVLVILAIPIFPLVGTSSATSSYPDKNIEKVAEQWCTQKFNGSTNQICPDEYVFGYENYTKPISTLETDAHCDVGEDTCSLGLEQGVAQAKIDAGTSSGPSANQDPASVYCGSQGFTGSALNSCESVYNSGYKAQTPTNTLCQSPPAGLDQTNCGETFAAGYAANPTAGSGSGTSQDQGLQWCKEPSNKIASNDLKACAVIYDYGYGASTNNGANFCQKPPGSIKESDCATIYNAGYTKGQAVYAQDANPQGSGNTSPTCEASGFSLSWILCPVFDLISDASQWIFQSIVQPFLVTQPITTNPNDPTYQIWSEFRVYGDILLVLVLLVVVIGESIGGGLIDAYSVKKILPRLLAAAILINLSIYIVAFMVDITNILGKGIGGLLAAPLTDCKVGAGNCWDFHLSNTDIASVFGVGLVGLLASSTAVVGLLTALFFSAGGLAAAAGTAITAAFFVALPMIFAVIAVFLTLVFRKGLILLLVLVSPVAFMLYVLPNTERYFRKWWDLLMEALLVYPIIVAIFGVADILSVELLQANSISPSDLTGHASFDLARILALVSAFLLQFLPLLAIPFAFRFASGLLGRVYSAATSAGGQAHKMATNRREQAKRDYAAISLAGRAKSYHAAQDFGQKHQGPFGVGRRASRWAARRAGGYNIEALMSAERASTDKQIQEQINAGHDAEVRGLTVNKQWALNQGLDGGWFREKEDGTRQFKSLGGKWIDEQDVDAGHSRWGNNQFAMSSALAYEERKASGEEINTLAKNYHNIAQAPGGWGLSDSEADTVWTVPAYATQDKNPHFRYVDWKTGELSRPEEYAQWTYEKGASYGLSQANSASIDALSKAAREAVKVMENPESSEADKARAAQELTYHKGAAETFMSRYSGVGGQIAGMEGETPITTAAGPAGGPSYQTNAQGSGATAEAIRRYAEIAGVYRPLDPNDESMPQQH